MFVSSCFSNGHLRMRARGGRDVHRIGDPGMFSTAMAIYQYS